VDLGEEEEAVMAVAIVAATVAATAAATAEVIVAATAEVIVAATVVAIVAAMAEVIEAVMAEVIVAAMAEVIVDQVLLTLISLQVQKAGKIEVMVILLKTPNMKVVEVEEKEECLMIVM
tara:strand:+ start:215 stop:571 length:357 start_codon:yes stop_codon:yes gene_type:complete